MKTIWASIMTVILMAASAVAGLDTTGLTYTTVANGEQAGGTATTNGVVVWVDVSALKGNAKLVVSDVPTTATAGAYAVELFTGSATNAITTKVTTVAPTTSTNAASVDVESVDTQTLSKYVQIRWTAMDTTTVHKVSAVLVSY